MKITQDIMRSITSTCSSSLSLRKATESDEIKGYRDITTYGEQYIAVGTDGRINIISSSEELIAIENNVEVHLNAVVCSNSNIIVVGNSGTILYSKNGEKFNKVESGIGENINSVIEFNGILIAAADKGIILYSDDCIHWQSTTLQLKGNIVSLSANHSICMGVTNMGEIIKTSGAGKWIIFDYNREYEGFSMLCIFKAVKFCGGSFIVIGQ